MNTTDNILMQIKNNNDELLLELLQASYKIKICEHTAQPIPLDLTDSDVTVLGTLLNYLLTKEVTSCIILIKETYRCLRNFVVLNENIQNMIIDNNSILQNTLILIETEEIEHNEPCLKMILLFLINLSVNNRTSSEQVWNVFESPIQSLLVHKVLSNNVAALIYNVFQNIQIAPSLNLLQCILSLIEDKNDSEYLSFLLEYFIKNHFIHSSYPSLTSEHHIIILEELNEHLNKRNLNVLPRDFLLILVNEFKRKSDCILKTVTDYLKQIEPYEVSLLLDVIASVSSDEKYLITLQSDHSFLINCAFLLKSIHSAGKAGENNFTAIQKLAHMVGNNKDVNEHPAFGFKASLIRIIGNLAWKSRCNQDELRELECIPLLLDCCNMDARNPFIIQWVIFAVRNLCDKNTANQQVIASLNKQGVIDSATINELGMTLHGDGNSEIKIVPLPMNK